MPARTVVTGGLGFIGSAFVRRLVARGVHVTNLDAGTYAADRRRVPAGHDLLVDETADVTSDSLADLVARSKASVLVHFAAETHVTRGETAADDFFRTNVDGTGNVLRAADRAGIDLVVHVSTDEVYGPALPRPFAEEDKAAGPGRATSAYARSKALADDLALAFDGGPRVIVVRPTNCFGPWQHPEKAIPRWITRALAGQSLPVWGDGGYVRDWMFVDDVCRAIEILIEERAPGGAYNVGPEGEPAPNLAIARSIARLAGRDEDAVYLTAYDRPDHDRRYSVDSSKMRALGWAPEVGLEQGLRATVEWYRTHREWWEPLVASAEALYDDERRRAAR
ncbi:MAG: NAD-dependent epimerase/dehydratase family protein [Actinomycetota bacterium]|nr:NAD-dependent epimerase/dehydratase family protein [Actinomycetota bacterium]